MPTGALTPADIDAARLPAAYLAAREALATCDRLDECQAWADRAHALASYARQARDGTLLKLARRIKARAVHRMGTLLRDVPSRKGQRTDLTAAGPPTRAAVARTAGLSRGQARDAIRVASVPRAAFERAVEGPHPPTVTALAARGIRPCPRPPSVTRQAARVHLMLKRFAEFAADEAPEAAARAVEQDTHVLRARVVRSAVWLAEFNAALDAAYGGQRPPIAMKR
jgi:hypothetical protein